MNIQTRSLFLGFGAACLLLALVVAALFFLGSDTRPIFREQALPSGKLIKVMAFHLAWGVEHDERRNRDDAFVLEYVSTVPHADTSAVDRETLEAFELIRPTSERWGFNTATVSAFPAVERKGKYYLYAFTRGSDGNWTFQRDAVKVFVSD